MCRSSIIRQNFCLYFRFSTFAAVGHPVPHISIGVEFSRLGSPKRYEYACEVLHKLSKSKSLSPAQNYLILTMPLGWSFVFLSLLWLPPDGYLLHIHFRHSGPVPYLHHMYFRYSGPVPFLHHMHFRYSGPAPKFHSGPVLVFVIILISQQLVPIEFRNSPTERAIHKMFLSISLLSFTVVVAC